MSNPNVSLTSPGGGNLADRIESAGYDSIKADSFVDSVEVPSNKPEELGINQNISDKESGALGRFGQMAQDLKTEKVESAKEKAMNGTGIVGQQRDEKIKREAEEQTVRITPQTSTNNVYGSAKYITGEDRFAADIGNGKIQGFDRGLTSQGDQENSKFPSQDALKTASESAMKQVKENQLKERFGPATEDSKRRAEDLRRFRDQTELGKGESIGSSAPQDFPVEETVQSKQQVEQEKKEDKSFVAKGLEQSNQMMEAINKLLKENPNNPEVKQQVINMNNSIIAFIQGLSNTKTAEEVQIPQNSEAVSAQAVQQPVEQKEQAQKAEKKAEQDAKERKWQKAALIAGVVGGATTGLLGGAAVAGSAALITLGVGAGNNLLRFIGEKRQVKLTEKIASAATQAEKDKLQKRYDRWTKVLNATKYISKFVKGFGYGLLASTFVSKVFMGGEGLIDKFRPDVTPNVVAGKANIGQPNPQGPHLGQGNGISTGAGSTSATEVAKNFDTGLIQNGRINLPGSAWNGNMAGGPTGTLSGGETLYSNYAGGQFNMAAFQFNKDLAQAGLKVTDLTEKMGTGGVHRLLNGYLNAIREGSTNPDLLTVLKDTNLPGATDIIGKISNIS